MACAGAHCTNHSTGTASCVGHRPSCPTNRPLASSADFGTQGARVRASDVNDLRYKLRNEIAAYNVNQSARSLPTYTITMPAGITIIDDIDNDDANQLYEMTRQMPNTPNTPQSVADFDPIDDAFWDTMIANYNAIRQDCICNSNCSCNAVCACHNDCGCNYSDRRLKKEIVYC